MDIFNYKCLSKKFENKNNKVEKYFKNLLCRVLIVTILCLLCSIFIKTSEKYKEVIYKNIYNQNLSFTSIKKFYDKYLGGVVPIDNIVDNTKPVFNEKLMYTEKSKFLDGVKLKVTTNYLVPVIQSGIVVFVGEKEVYGKTIIIQGMDGIDIWYSNIDNSNIDLYDYIEEKTLLGNTINDELYLTYSKDGKFLNYEDFLE